MSNRVIRKCYRHRSYRQVPTFQLTYPMDHVELPFEISDALDSWIAEQPDPKPSRAEAIGLALMDWLVVMGRVPVDLELANGQNQGH